MSNQSPSLLGVVLCGGKSMRMGRDKAALPLPLHRRFAGSTFLDHAYHRLHPFVESVVVSIAEPNNAISRRYPTITDSSPGYGPIGGLESALTHADQRQLDGCLLTAVDTPFLTADDIGALRCVFDRDPTMIVCATIDDMPTDLREIQAGPDSYLVTEPQRPHYEPLVAVYPTRVLPVVRKAIEEQRFGLQRLLAQLSAHQIRMSSRSLRNFNTPTDLRALSDDP
ncbi:molybdenum cofactor guanylyltransferase [Roseiconus lacunae]|uniref:molybdenum cofactor guanylyltransferase n=1 Tax=Roseiconus lacunae TaxID=2605694 RepID=UPI0011F1403A|nr:molybdenum cofactor guanylyltransferase [Roseiconus lacunae]